MAFRCGCDPREGIVCGVHCQVQGCERADEWSTSLDVKHTAACVRGDRIEPTDLSWFSGEPVPQGGAR